MLPIVALVSHQTGNDPRKVGLLWDRLMENARTVNHNRYNTLTYVLAIESLDRIYPGLSFSVDDYTRAKQFSADYSSQHGRGQ